jgi:membrane dipeptidase
MTPLETMTETPRIADAHNDLLIEVAFRRPEPEPFARHWLGKLRAGNVTVQVCPVSAAGLENIPESALRRALEQVVAAHRAVRENPAVVAPVCSGSELRSSQDEGRLGLLLSMEGADALGYDPEMADAFWLLGVRMFSLTWNPRNAFADGSSETGGSLSRLGRELVDRLRDMGAMIDLSHASPGTFDEIIARADEASLLISHTGCRAVFDTPRNSDDDQLKAIGERGGVIGIMAHPLTVDTDRPTVDRLVDHIDHAVKTVGPGAVCLGSDFITQVFESGAAAPPPTSHLPGARGSGADTALVDFRGPDDFPTLVEALRARGYDDDRLEAVLYGNLVRFLSRSLPS